MRGPNKRKVSECWVFNQEQTTKYLFTEVKGCMSYLPRNFRFSKDTISAFTFPPSILTTLATSQHKNEKKWQATSAVMFPVTGLRNSTQEVAIELINLHHDSIWKEKYNSLKLDEFYASQSKSQVSKHPEEGTEDTGFVWLYLCELKISSHPNPCKGTVTSCVNVQGNSETKVSFYKKLNKCIQSVIIAMATIKLKPILKNRF